MFHNSHLRYKVETGSGVRKMFELARRMRTEGKDPIDLSLGNPDIRPPQEFYDALSGVIADTREASFNMHGYMSNPGFPEARERVAQDLMIRWDLQIGADDIFMTAGAANALDVILMSILEPPAFYRSGNAFFRDETLPKRAGLPVPLDEVVLIAPYFPEYNGYVVNNSGLQTIADSGADFQLDIASIDRKLTKRTKAIILNSPNNPTGVIFHEDSYQELSNLLNDRNGNRKHPIIVIEDSPYDLLDFEKEIPPSMMEYYTSTIYVTSLSKSLGIAGERIGYFAVHPNMFENAEDARIGKEGLTNNLRQRVVNAPALMQRMVARIGTYQTGDVEAYASRIDQLAGALKNSGYEFVQPEGGFYIFPKIPDQFQDMDEFMRLAHSGDEPLLFVPGAAFGSQTYCRNFRLSAAVPQHDIDRACQAIKRISELKAA